MRAVFTGVLQDTAGESGLPGRTGSLNGLAYTLTYVDPPAPAPLPAVGGLLLAAPGGGAGRRAHAPSPG